MKRFLMLILTLVSLTGISTTTTAQGEAALPFLLISPDSRAGGIGESGGAIADNATAIFWNPGGIAFLDGTEFNITHANWLPQFNLDLFYDYFAGRHYMEELGGSITGSIRYMSYGEITRTNEGGDELGTFRSYDVAMTVGYATKLSEDWGIGVNARLIHSRLADQPTANEAGEGVATSVSFDVGVMWRPSVLNIPLVGDLGNRLSIGANLSNVGPNIYYIDQKQADNIPQQFRLAFAGLLFKDEYNSLTYTLDFTKLLVDEGDANVYSTTDDSTSTKTSSTREKDEFYSNLINAWGDESFGDELKDVVTSMGLEYWYGTPDDFMIAFRGGFFYEDPNEGNRKFITLGSGLRYDIYGFDFSYLITDVFEDGENHPLSQTLRFTLSIGFGGTTQGHGFPRGK